MSSKKMDLNKRSFFILSGVSNQLGKTLAIEMCNRFKPGSVVIIIDSSEDDLQECKKELQLLPNRIEVVCCPLNWQLADASLFRKLLGDVLNHYDVPDYFEFAFILHNEGVGATQKLMEPQVDGLWMQYVQENLYAVVGLNQEFIKLQKFVGVQKLIVNITSSLMVLPLVHNSLMCSCMKARDMYFRAMVDEEHDVAVLSYSPGIMESHKPVVDLNNNIIDLLDLNVDEKLLKLPRVKPQQSTLKLINILEEMSFISGHDVDYYDTFNL